MSRLNQTLCLFKHYACNLNMSFCRFIECGGNNLCIHRSSHVRNFLRALVNEQHHKICFWMIGCNGIGDVLHQDGFTRLGLCHDKCTLSFSYGRKQVYDARWKVCCGRITTKIELLVGEQRRKMLEGNAISYFIWCPTINHVDACQWEILLPLTWRAPPTLYHIASFQAIFLHLLRRDIYIVGRRKIVVIARTQETIAVGHDFKYAVCRYQVREIVSRRCWLHWLRLLIASIRHPIGGIVEHVVVGQRTLIFDWQVNNSDEICSIPRVSFPTSFPYRVGPIVWPLIASIYFGLQLCQQSTVGSILVFSHVGSLWQETGLRHRHFVCGFRLRLFVNNLLRFGLYMVVGFGLSIFVRLGSPLFRRALLPVFFLLLFFGLLCQTFCFGSRSGFSLFFLLRFSSPFLRLSGFFAFLGLRFSCSLLRFFKQRWLFARCYLVVFHIKVLSVFPFYRIYSICVFLNNSRSFLFLAQGVLRPLVNGLLV